jgi:hypothetical protein
MGVMERIATFAVSTEPYVRRMGLQVILRMVAFRFDVASPVLSWPTALRGKAVPDVWVEYLSRHTLPIMQGYVKNPFPVPDLEWLIRTPGRIPGIEYRQTSHRFSIGNRALICQPSGRHHLIFFNQPVP